MSAVKRYMIDPRDNIGLGTIGTNALQFVLASDFDALRLQLSRARGYLMAITNTSYRRPDAIWMQFHHDEWDEATRGLTEFLKEVGGEGK